MRAAVLASKRAIDAQQTSRREELLRSSAVREKQTLNEKVTCVAMHTITLDGFTYSLHVYPARMRS